MKGLGVFPAAAGRRVVCMECRRPLASLSGRRRYHVECQAARRNRLGPGQERNVAKIEAMLALVAKRAKQARRMAA